MNVGILGYGTVGSGVFELLEKLNSTSSFDIQVKKVFSFPGTNNPKCHTSNIDDILLDSNIDCVVEALGGLSPAYEYICSALKFKKHVITANKAVVAKHLEEFLKLAKENEVYFLFESAIGGGIPWVASLEKIKRVEAISSFYGIFNGTSNYILDSMTHKDIGFEEALKQAQDLGYAECDPSADVDGFDVLSKVHLSASLAFDVNINSDLIVRFPMRNVRSQDINYFKYQDLSLKYIGEAHWDESSYEGMIALNIFPFDTIEANVNSNYNIGTVCAPSIGKLKFYGQGAGKFPTANAIIQDIIDVYLKVERPLLNLKSAPYVAKKLNRYVLRSRAVISSSLIAFKEGDYYHTVPITSKHLMAIVKQIDDPSLFIAKFADF